MIPQKITFTSVVVAIAIASIAIVGLSHTQQTNAQSAPLGNNVYVFAEGVSPQATFKFRDATVTYEFQMYDTVSNLFSSGGSSSFTTRQVSPEFTLARVVGDTPYLHEAVDQTFQYNGKSSAFDYPYKEFDVIVELIQAGQSMRTMEYADCSITNYKINTRTDNEEAYTTGGKTGFAAVETYSFACTGFTPHAPMYDKLVKEQQNKKPYE
ncbi:MAG: hypothetical protein ACK4TO_02185 [Candidatus Nitrosotenuis sp.]